MKKRFAKVLSGILAAAMMLGTVSSAATLPDGREPLPQDDISSIERVFPSYPNNNDLSQTLIFKMALDYGGLEVGNSNLHQGRLTVEYILEYFRQLDNVTRGVPKICALAGFQEGGHDWQYPAMYPLNSQIKSEEHPEWDGPTCIHYIMEEAKKYNVRCTVHTNIVDAYDNSPLFDYYKENGLLARDANGNYYKGWMSPHGQAYSINLKKSFEDPNGVRYQIDKLFELLPEIVETGVLYTDANIVMSASEYDGISAQEQAEAYRDIVSWIKNKYNVDVVGEYGIQRQYGYVSHGMTWDGGGDTVSSQPMKVPAYIMAGGESHVGSNSQIDIFGGSVQLEHEPYHDLWTAGGRFAQKTLPYFFLNTKLRENYISDKNYAQFSDNVKSMRYTGSEGEVGQYDPSQTATLVYLNRLWNGPSGSDKYYAYEDKNGNVKFGNKSETGLYQWEVISADNGKIFQNTQTGHYLGVSEDETRVVAYAEKEKAAVWQYENTWESNAYRMKTAGKTEDLYMGSDGYSEDLNSLNAEIGITKKSDICDWGWSSIVWKQENAASAGTGDDMLYNAQVISQNDKIYKIDNDLFMPVVWREMEIMAYSQNGGTRTWKMPEGWETVTAVDIYDITKEGLANKQENVDVSSGELTLTLEANRSKTIVPAGTDPNTNAIQPTGGTAEYVGTDSKTSGNWQDVYGSQGYSIAGGDESLKGITVERIGSEEKVWAEETDDPRALVSGDGRVAAADTSVLHQIIDLDVGEGTKKVSAYLLDWANEGSQTLVEVIDPNTMKSLSAVLVNDYADGKYVSFNVSGHVQLRFTRIYNEDFSNVGAPYVAGVFFDEAGEIAESSKEANIYDQTRIYSGEAVLGEETTIGIEAISRDCGELEYQWQESADGAEWTDIEGANSDRYTFSALTKEEQRKQYRCVVTNTRRGWETSTIASEIFTFGDFAEETDKSLLQKTYDYALMQSTEGVTDAAKKVFEDAVAAVKEVLDDIFATQDEVNTAWRNLVDAIHGLGVVQGDKTNLGMLIEMAEAMEESRYVETNWPQLVEALAAAKTVMDDGNALEEDVQKAADDLLNAILAQRLKANKDNLEDLIQKASEIDVSQYTAESVAVFQAALKTANLVLEDETLSEDDQDVVDKAVSDLNAAIENLSVKDDDTSKPDDGSDDISKPDDEKGDSNISTEDTSKPDAPATGDNNLYAGAALVMVLSMTAIGLLIWKRKQAIK